MKKNIPRYKPDWNGERGGRIKGVRGPTTHSLELHSRPQSCDPFGQRHGSRALVRSESRKSANHGLQAFCAASEI